MACALQERQKLGHISRPLIQHFGSNHRACKVDDSCWSIDCSIDCFLDNHLRQSLFGLLQVEIQKFGKACSASLGVGRRDYTNVLFTRARTQSESERARERERYKYTLHILSLKVGWHTCSITRECKSSQSCSSSINACSVEKTGRYNSRIEGHRISSMVKKYFNNALQHTHTHISNRN
jgi:hypothetical protein